MSTEDVYKASISLLAPLSLETTYLTIVDEAKKLFHAQEGSILLKKNGKLTRVFASCPIIADTQVRQNGRTYQTFKKNTPRVVHIRSRKDIHPRQYPYGYQSIIMIPLSYKKKHVGVLNVFTKKVTKLSAQKYSVVKLFGAFVSLAIYKAEQYKKAEQSILVRDMFIAMASHELKTPLTSITIYSQMISSKIKKQELPNLQWIDSMSSQVKWLNSLTSEILQVKTIQGGKLHYQEGEVHLTEITKKAVEAFSSLFPHHAIALETSLTLKNDIFWGDQYKLLQVLVNLLNNSGKFSPPQSTIRISITKERRIFNMSVIDQGEGIEKKDLSKVFEGFYKGGSQTKEGMGLGLFLVREIVEHYHGTVTADSSVGKGTKITIRLPEKIL